MVPYSSTWGVGRFWGGLITGRGDTNAVIPDPGFAVVTLLAAASLKEGVLGLVLVVLPAAPPKAKVKVVVVVVVESEVSS